jgi:pimeloyl-ACP methyl ester carboxylesterase
MTAKIADKSQILPVVLTDQGMLDLGSETLEYRMIGPRPDAAPTIVMLHEGYGSVGMWGDFPDRVAAATGCGVFVYSRKGFGKSSAATLPRAMSYMHEEAKDSLPKLLDAIGFKRGLLLGHSDGASIAAIYAGTHQDHRVCGLVLLAPHFIVEDLGMKSIAEANEAYNSGDLRARLARWHSDVDAAFRGWTDVWLNNDFRQWNISEELAYIRVPILIVQGEDDQYGTVRQIEIAQEECYCPVDVAMLPGAKHQPHREAAEATLTVIADFVGRVLRNDPEQHTAL